MLNWSLSRLVSQLAGGGYRRRFSGETTAAGRHYSCGSCLWFFFFSLSKQAAATSVGFLLWLPASPGWLATVTKLPLPPLCLQGDGGCCYVHPSAPALSPPALRAAGSSRRLFPQQPGGPRCRREHRAADDDPARGPVPAAAGRAHARSAEEVAVWVGGEMSERGCLVSETVL